MDNQTTFKTIKPQPIEDRERYFNNKRILCDIEHLQEQLTEKQMELLANSINPNEYMDKYTQPQKPYVRPYKEYLSNL